MGNSVDSALSQFGLPARTADRLTIISSLQEQIRREADEEGDQFLMRLLCAQLFSLGVVNDSLLIWAAKSCNFDTSLGIDVQFLCGAGLELTKNFLKTNGSDASLEALKYLTECEASGDFREFSVAVVLQQAKDFYCVA
jgi:hypothetical protein